MSGGSYLNPSSQKDTTLSSPKSLSENAMNLEKSHIVKCASLWEDIPKSRVDYMDTFASVTCLESMQTVLHIGANNNWEINRMDIKTVFLHGDLKEELYMDQPEGMEEPRKEDWIHKLNKSLYGLKQASQRWAKKLHDSLAKEGWVQNSVEHSVYKQEKDGDTAIAAIHIDDALTTASSPMTMKNTKDCLQNTLISWI